MPQWHFKKITHSNRRTYHTQMRYQYSLGDIFLISAVAAVVLAAVVLRESVIAFVALGLSLPLIWRRAIILRCWLVLTSSLGSGLAWFVHNRQKYEAEYLDHFGMLTDELAGWGIGMLVGGIVAYWLFLRNPPA